MRLVTDNKNIGGIINTIVT